MRKEHLPEHEENNKLINKWQQQNYESNRTGENEERCTMNDLNLETLKTKCALAA